jgi:hypothetical protein
MKRSTAACVAVLFLTSVFSLLLWGDAQSTRPAVGGQHDLQVQSSALGKVIRLRLQAAPFPHPDRQAGYLFDQVQYPASPHYDDSSVAVFVPAGYHAKGPVNLVVFFHGWETTIDDAQQRFDLFRQFAQSGAQALLVLPELARNAPDSFGGKLEDTGGFTRFITELMGALSENGVIKDTKPGNVVLAGHSGAFQVIAIILTHGEMAANIREIWLFDALYARVHQYASWIEKQAGRFVSVSSAGSEETTVVDDLIAALNADRVPYVVVHDSPDNDNRALRGRVVFLQSDSDHYGVVVDHDEFRRLLGSSPLLAP